MFSQCSCILVIMAMQSGVPQPPRTALARAASLGAEPSNPYRPTNIVGGSFEYFAATDGLKKSCFTSLELLSQWPTKLIEAIFSDKEHGPIRKRRFESVLQCGMTLHTCFSGKGSVEQTFRMLQAASADMSLRLPDVWLHCHSAILSPSNPVIQLTCHPAILPYCHQVILSSS